MEDNENLHNEVEQIKKDYKQKEFDNEWQYKSKIKGLEKENNRLHRIIDKFHDTIDKFIHWICKKFDMGAEDNLVRDFERKNHILIDAERQVKKKIEKKSGIWKDNNRSKSIKDYFRLDFGIETSGLKPTFWLATPALPNELIEYMKPTSIKTTLSDDGLASQ